LETSGVDVLLTDQTRRKRKQIPESFGAIDNKISTTTSSSALSGGSQASSAVEQPPFKKRKTKISTKSTTGTEESTNAETRPDKLAYYSKVQQRYIEIAKKRLRLSVVIKDGFPEPEMVRMECKEMLFEIVHDAKAAIITAHSGVMSDDAVVNEEQAVLDVLITEPILSPLCVLVCISHYNGVSRCFRLHSK
jgi:hypothetical protein